jgi:hypothetical protein
MTQTGQSFFYFFAGEIFSLALALLIKEEKTRITVLLLGTAVSGYIGFIWQPSLISPKDGDHQSTIVEQAIEPSENLAVSPPQFEAVSITEPPTQTPHVTIIGGSAVLSYLDSTKVLGQLAEEQYSLAERNKVNQTLTFTINLGKSQSAIWRYYWCATKKNILIQNMQAIDVEFILNGEDISNQFNSRYFPYTEDPMKGWTCLTYEVVLTDWESGIHHLEQNTTISQPINDGESDFPEGYKIFEYTINVP